MKKRNSQILKGRGKQNAAILRRENRKVQYVLTSQKINSRYV